MFTVNWQVLSANASLLLVYFSALAASKKDAEQEDLAKLSNEIDDVAGHGEVSNASMDESGSICFTIRGVTSCRTRSTWQQLINKFIGDPAVEDRSFQDPSPRTCLLFHGRHVCRKPELLGRWDPIRGKKFSTEELDVLRDPRRLFESCRRICHFRPCPKWCKRLSIAVLDPSAKRCQFLCSTRYGCRKHCFKSVRMVRGNPF